MMSHSEENDTGHCLPWISLSIHHLSVSGDKAGSGKKRRHLHGCAPRGTQKLSRTSGCFLVFMYLFHGSPSFCLKGLLLGLETNLLRLGFWVLNKCIHTLRNDQITFSQSSPRLSRNPGNQKRGFAMTYTRTMNKTTERQA